MEKASEHLGLFEDELTPPRSLPPDIRYVGELERVDVKPGDKFVVTCPEAISSIQAAMMVDHVKKAFGSDIIVLVLASGCKLGIVGNAD